MPKIIFEKNEKSQIPDHLQGKEKELEDGTFELDAGGVLKKYRDVLNEKKKLDEDFSELTTEANTLRQEKTRLLSGQLPDGKVAVEPEIEKLGNAARSAGLKHTEINTLKTENEAYKALGAIDDIQPKLAAYTALGTVEEIKSKTEGYDNAIQTAKQAEKDEALRSVGIDPNQARKFVVYKELEFESEEKDGKKIFNRVTRDEKGKDIKTAFDAEYLKTADDLKEVFTAEPQKTRLIRQGTIGGGVDLVEKRLAQRYAPPEKAKDL